MVGWGQVGGVTREAKEDLTYEGRQIRKCESARKIRCSLCESRSFRCCYYPWRGCQGYESGLFNTEFCISAGGIACLYEGSYLGGGAVGVGVSWLVGG